MTKSHEHWASRLGFIMATAGSAVGLGSLWRFPYIAGENGGGAFVLLYLLFTFGIGLPVFIGELIIGRKTQKSAVLGYSEIANGSQNWRILGWLNVLTCLIILSYYSVVSGWCLSYALMSLNKFTLGKSPDQIKETFSTLFTSPGINIFWFALFLLMNVGIIMSGVRQGIEYWSKKLMPALFIILIGLFCYSVTLPGFMEAFNFVFIPDFSKLTTTVVLNALGMAFFTLSVSLGIIVTYGSYMHREDNIPYNSFLITLMTVFVSLIAALITFPIVFTSHLPPEGGPGLVFQTLPILFAQIPASTLISTIFFLLLLFAALTSTMSLLEVLVANVIEVFDITRKKATILCALLTFVVGIPSALSGSRVLFPSWEEIYGKNFFDTMSYTTASWFMPLAGLFVTFLIGWKMKRDDALEEFMRGCKCSFFAKPWLFLIKWICPVIVLLIILQEAGLLKFIG